MSIQATLGQTLERKGKTWLVVRMINQSITLFENEDGSCYSLTESYIELRDELGTPDFITLSEREEIFTEKKSTIKALTPQTWRVK